MIICLNNLTHVFIYKENNKDKEKRKTTIHCP
uniref:Uncharacterized protein n=1 Tax=viral metagenome TaxID=1070528 RepID=A0A6C0HWT9_9ZZZZ